MSDDRREGAAVYNPSPRKIKRARDSINGVDFISCLPDAILQHIFSLIPTKLAIRTSVLSKRWKHVWSGTPSLNFHCNRSDLDSVHKTLASRYSAPKITTFHLSISSSSTDDNHQIESLINFAVSRDTEKLSLRFDHPYFIPEVLYTSCSLKQLFIESSSGTNNNVMIPRHTTTVSWTSLKKLSLRFCLLPDGACAKILSASPLLECLTLCCCDELERLDLSKCLMLKRLVVETSEPMKIVAPHLHCLKLAHTDESQCDLVDVSSLTQAKVNMYGPRRCGFLFDAFGDLQTLLADSFQIMILETLDKLKNVEKLTLSGAFCLQILSLAVLCGVPFPTLKVEALTLETAIYPSIIPGVAELLQNSPGLKTIKLDIVDCNNIINEHCLANYLYSKGLETRQCWTPKDLSLSEPKLMTCVMTFLLKTSSGEDRYTVGCYTFSQNKNGIFCHGLNSRLFFRH